MSRGRRVARLAWWALSVSVGVIILGALVRATGSGAGCGRNWPSCQGEIVPAFTETATAIEYLHRVTSGIALVVVFALYLRIRRAESPGTQLRRAGLVSMLLIIGEALIGAGIVLFEWVAEDSSAARAVAVPIHLVNTLFLLGALTAVVYLSGGRSIAKPAPELRRVIKVGLGAMILVAATGAVAALADSLFPSESLAQGIVEDFDAAASFLTRLRVIHPFVAVAAGVFVVWLVTKPRAVADLRDSLAARAVVWLVVGQVIAGGINVLLLVPVWTQLVHLLLADLLWISLVWFALDASRVDQSEAIIAS